MATSLLDLLPLPEEENTKIIPIVLMDEYYPHGVAHGANHCSCDACGAGYPILLTETAARVVCTRELVPGAHGDRTAGVFETECPHCGARFWWHMDDVALGLFERHNERVSTL